jgi:hypothetical protein
MHQLPDVVSWEFEVARLQHQGSTLVELVLWRESHFGR